MNWLYELVEAREVRNCSENRLEERGRERQGEQGNANKHGGEGMS